MHFSAAVASLPILLLSTSVAVSKAQDLVTGNLQGCVGSGNFDADFDYFPDKFEPPVIFTYNDDIDIFGNKFVPHTTTDLLEITYHKTYKIVTNKFHDVSYLLYQCGTVPPQDEIDSGRHHLVLSIPHTGGVAITETPQIPPMELLGKREEIIAYIGNPIYVSSPCMMHMMGENATDNKIETYFNKPEQYNSTDKALQEAAFLEKHPEAIIFGGPLGDKNRARVVSVAASQERTNVATFDWIALFAALYNLEAMSNKITSETQARYDCTSSNAAALSAEKQRERRSLEEETKKPVVFWAQYFNGGYNWSVAECPTWDKTYYCEYAKHCGAKMLSRPQGVGTNIPEGSVYWYLTDEEMLELGKDADIWIYSGKTFFDVYAHKNETMDQFKAVKNKMVFDTQGQGPHSWYEQRLAEYDVVALDFCDIVGTANPDATHERRWFRNIYTEAIGELEECRIPDELTEPYVPNGAQCTLLSADGESGANMVSSMTTLVAVIMVACSAFLGF